MALTPAQQAQLQRDLNSPNPQLKAQAQKIFAALLKQDPQGMAQFQQQAAPAAQAQAGLAQLQQQMRQQGLTPPPMTVPKPTQPAPNPAAGQSTLPATPNTAPQGGGGQKAQGAAKPPTPAPAPMIPQNQQQNAAQNAYRATSQAQNNPMGSAQLGYALNSNDPQQKAAAQAQFKQSLLNDPAAMQKFRNEVNAGKQNTAPAGGGGQKPQPNPSTTATPNAGSGYASPEQTVKMFQALMTQDPAKGYAFARGEGEFARPGSGQKTPQGSSSAAQPLPTGPKPVTPAAPAGPTFADALGAQFGADNPFGVRELGGENPLETAKAAAQRMLESNIANTRARFGGMGTANSDRAALAEGQAIGDMSTFLGDRLANIGEQAFQNDANRALSAILGAGQNDLARSQLALGLNQQLGGFGTGLTGVGAQETQIPNLGEIIGYLAAFSGAGGGGTSKGSGAQGFGWKR